MLGRAIYRTMAEQGHATWGTFRRTQTAGSRSVDHGVAIENVDIRNLAHTSSLLADIRPDMVINCVGVRSRPDDAAAMGPFIHANACWPHDLAKFAKGVGARMVHFSSDGVFSGARGNYSESDPPDGADDYAISKRLGEPSGDHVLVLRMSIIGHSEGGKYGLIDWFLKQEQSARGYTRSRFCGLPTCEVATMLARHVLPDATLSGLFHVGAKPIDKFSLLQQVAAMYGRDIEVVPDHSVELDRTLDTSRFAKRTGYTPADWPILLKQMLEFG